MPEPSTWSPSSRAGLRSSRCPPCSRRCTCGTSRGGVSEPRDEAHTDPAAQELFYVAGRDEDDDEELALEPESRTEATRSHEAHESLRALIDGPLWYLVLHDDGELPRPMVALLAIGRSKRGSHLIGVATQQWYRGLRA